MRWEWRYSWSTVNAYRIQSSLPAPCFLTKVGKVRHWKVGSGPPMDMDRRPRLKEASKTIPHILGIRVTGEKTEGPLRQSSSSNRWVACRREMTQTKLPTSCEEQWNQDVSVSCYNCAKPYYPCMQTTRSKPRLANRLRCRNPLLGTKKVYFIVHRPEMGNNSRIGCQPRDYSTEAQERKNELSETRENPNGSSNANRPPFFANGNSAVIN